MSASTISIPSLSMVRLAVLWHFLDIVWIGIFSIVYIGGLA